MRVSGGFIVAVLLLPLLLMSTGCGGGATPSLPAGPPPAVALNTVVNGLNSPVDLQVPDDNSGRSFVVEQAGVIRIIANGALLPANFLDIRNKVDFDGGEMGLLGLALHPNYSQSRHFYVNYNPSGGARRTVIAEYQASAADPNVADPASERILLTISQPFPNHKGGQLAFGPDGFLYIGLGDGGDAGDPLNNGQNLFVLLGKMLRIDVDPPFDFGLQYHIPVDNPFAGGGGLPEIWAYGFRNPWRFSFERGASRLFCADVGQANWEEIDLVTKQGNFGWRTMEGAHCFNPSSGCNTAGLILPIAEYNHSEGEAVIGGYVYKGSAIPGLVGRYIFGDLNGKIWSLAEGPPGTWTRTQLLSTGRVLSSFGQDAAGEVFVVDYSGSVLKLVAP